MSMPEIAEARHASALQHGLEESPGGDAAHLRAASAEEARRLVCNLKVLAPAPRQPERDLRDSREFLRAVIDAIPHLMMVIDLDYRIVLANAAAREMTGGKDPVRHGLTCHRLLHQSDVPCKTPTDGCPLRQVVATKAPVTTTHCHFHANGKEVPLQISMAPLFDEAGEVAQVVQLSQDFTERMEAQEREDQLRCELAHLARVKTMGEMASGIAHELNQPLAAILMQAEVAAHKLRHAAKQNNNELLETLDHIADQAHRAGEIIRHMKEFVQKTQPYRVAISLAGVVVEVVALVKNDLRHAGIQFEVDVEDALPMILGDKIQLQQVLLNLIRNAMEAMRSTAADARRLRLSAQLRGDVLEITTSDTGCGVSEGRFDELFGTFCSAKPGGMGLGLAISRSIIEAHGGQLWARDNAGRGTAFVFTLPMAHEDCEHGG